MSAMPYKKFQIFASRAFRRGFADAFLGTGSLFVSKRLSNSGKYEVSVEKAWAEVGRAFHDVMRSEGIACGAKTDKSSSRPVRNGHRPIGSNAA
jgi:hypothetical protein